MNYKINLIYYIAIDRDHYRFDIITHGIDICGRINNDESIGVGLRETQITGSYAFEECSAFGFNTVPRTTLVGSAHTYL